MDLGEIKAALEKATGCPTTVTIEGDKLTFSCDGGPTMLALGGWCGGETKGVITLYSPIPIFIIPRMISGVNPLRNQKWKELLQIS